MLRTAVDEKPLQNVLCYSATAQKSGHARPTTNTQIPDVRLVSLYGMPGARHAPRTRSDKYSECRSGHCKRDLPPAQCHLSASFRARSVTTHRKVFDKVRLRSAGYDVDAMAWLDRPYRLMICRRKMHAGELLGVFYERSKLNGREEMCNRQSDGGLEYEGRES
jgi:hypothetical protein